MVHLSGISWQTDETLLEELSYRRLRLTYKSPGRGKPASCVVDPPQELCLRLFD